MALGAAKADGGRRRVGSCLSSSVAAVSSATQNALGALSGTRADERGDLLAAEPRALFSLLIELSQQGERREAPVDAREAEVVRHDGLEGGSVLIFFFRRRGRGRGR